MNDDVVHLGPGKLMVTGDGPEASPIRVTAGEVELQLDAEAAMKLAILLAECVALYAEGRGLYRSPFPPKP